MLRHWSPCRAARPVSMEGRIALGDARSLKSRGLEACPKTPDDARKERIRGALGKPCPNVLKKLSCGTRSGVSENFRFLPVLQNRLRPTFYGFETYESAQEDRKVVPD